MSTPVRTPPRTPTRSPSRTPGVDSSFFGGGGATCTPQKTRPRRVHQFFTPQPGTSARTGKLSWDSVGGIADVRLQVGAVRLRDEDEDSVENLRRALACDTAIFDGQSPAAQHRCTPPAMNMESPDGASTPPQAVSKPASPRNGALSWGADATPAMTPAKPCRGGHRRVDSSASASSLGGACAKASATPQPNINPFASPGRSVFGKSTSRHGRVIAHELAQAAKVAANNETTSHSTSHHAAARFGNVRPRFGFRHYLPWERVEDQPEGGVYVPIHQDVNGTVWLATGMLDGRPYAVKEVPFSASVDNCQGYSLEDQRAIAEDPAIFAEVAAMTLCSESAYIQRYYSVHHDPLLRVHVLQAQYCARGTLIEDTLAHHDAAADGRSSSPLLAGSMCSASGRGPLFAAIPEATVVRILQQVYQGVATLHGNGIAHNALHPRAVLVDDVGSCKVSQFGAARLVFEHDTTSTTGIEPSLPLEYEPTADLSCETPFTRDVYSFAAGMLHLVAVSHAQARGGALINDMSAVAVPDASVLLQLGYSHRLTAVFQQLTRPQARERPRADQVVAELSPPSPVMASLLELCDAEAARLRARLVDLRQQVAQRDASPPNIRSISRNQHSDDGASPVGNASSLFAGSVGQDAPGTLARRTRRPTQLMLSSSVSDIRAMDGVSPTMARDSVMSPGPLYAIRMHRRHSYAAVSFEAAIAPMDAERAATATPGHESPVNFDAQPFATAFGTSVSRDPRPGAHMNNSFDDTPNHESPTAGRQQASRFRFPTGSSTRQPQASGEAGTPSRAREDTSVDLFGGAVSATPPFMSPCADETPVELTGTGERRVAPEAYPASQIQTSQSPKDWTHGAHTETADEALRVLRLRNPNLERPSAPVQDLPRGEGPGITPSPFVPAVKPAPFRLLDRRNSLALVPNFDDE